MKKQELEELKEQLLYCGMCGQKFPVDISVTKLMEHYAKCLKSRSH